MSAGLVVLAFISWETKNIVPIFEITHGLPITDFLLKVFWNPVLPSPCFHHMASGSNSLFDQLGQVIFAVHCVVEEIVFLMGIL